jgi:hypothetical protein
MRLNWSRNSKRSGAFPPPLLLQWLPCPPLAAQLSQLTSLGLGEAKTMAETAGSKVLAGVGKDAANDAKKKLEEAGAAVVLE